MGTRGVFGIRVDNVDKLGYNHSDSYPSGLGLTMLEAARSLMENEQSFRESAKNLLLVCEDVEPSDKQIEKYSQYSNVDVSRQTNADWYCLLHQLQGDIEATLEAGVMLDGTAFILDSLFCEWGYVINLDDNIFEVYKGFQREPHLKGRYSKFHPNDEYHPVGNKYYPCALVVEFDLFNLPSEETFLSKVK